MRHQYKNITLQYYKSLKNTCCDFVKNNAFRKNYIITSHVHKLFVEKNLQYNLQYTDINPQSNINNI